MPIATEYFADARDRTKKDPTSRFGRLIIRKDYSRDEEFWYLYAQKINQEKINRSDLKNEVFVRSLSLSGKARR
jgi:hypothetical protein